MHWFNIIMLILLSGLILTLSVLFVVLWSKRPSELERTADEPDPFQPRISVTPLQMPSLGSDQEIRLQAMNDEHLVEELTRLMEQPTDQTPADPERTRRAEQQLQQMTHTSGTFSGAQEHPACGEGQGIVICAGGFVLASSAYVLVHQIRSAGCTLPIEIWHREREAFSENWQHAWEELKDVELRNIDAVSGVSFANQYTIKPLAVYYSRFQEVLLLDADNNVAGNPDTLFEHAQWDDQTAYFWPDFWPLDTKAKCWSALTEAQRGQVTQHVTQESGQLLLNKSLCIDALALCCRINVQLGSQLGRLFPGPASHSDKNTWVFSWIATDTPYKFLDQPRAGVAGVREDTGQFRGTTYIQHDLTGEPFFLHKSWAKWGSQTMHPQWTDVYRWSTARGNVNQWNHAFENAPTERALFPEIFGDLEDRCWLTLNRLREQPWYQAEYKQELQDIHA